MKKAKLISEEIDRQLDALVDRTLDTVYKADPEMEQRYGAVGKQRCREDLVFHFCTLTEALAAKDQGIFDRYVAWGKVVLASRNIAERDLEHTLGAMADTAQKLLTADSAAAACGMLETAIKALPEMPSVVPTFVPADYPFARAVNRYIEALLTADRSKARDVVTRLKRSGTRTEDIFVHVLERAQYEIGRLWQQNKISVAQEHYATATTEVLIAELYSGDPASKKMSRLFVGTCASGEAHCVGIRMLTDILDRQGWKVYFTGANTPVPSIVELLKQLDIDVLGISAATAMQARNVRKLVDAVRNSSRGKKTKILVGGKIFNESPMLWKTVGADGYAPNAVEGASVATSLAAGKDQTSPAIDPGTSRRISG